ncbi:hypothetical protein [Aquabacterium sp.]|uniref:hypothetical protein n=1 Tax=Aquabacterium sp. TaxID=1872578 RepID=UPI003783BDD3
MNPLRSAFARLFLPDPAQAPDRPATMADLQDAGGHVRAMVLMLRGPADWEPLRAVWRGVQADLGLPAPAIAVSGQDGLQLWFSAPAPVPATQAHRFLEALRQRYLPAVARHRLVLWPGADAASAPPAELACVPAPQPDGSRWSAFVAADLAPIFSETPWLDMPPSEDGQAKLLAALSSLPADGLATSLATLAPPAAAAPAGPAGPTAATPLADEPRAFLLRVMNDDSVPLALRIEAAKALLH